MVLCLGDSITESTWGNYPAQLDKMFKKNHVPFKAISQGRPGNTSGEYLTFFLKSDMLEKYNPDVIVIMLGTNDVRIDSDNTPTPKYKDNMLKIIKHIRDFAKKNDRLINIYLCTIPPLFVPSLHTFTEKSSMRIEKEIIPEILKLSVDHNLKLIDIHSMFMKNKDLLPGVHPSPGGYYMIAKTIFNRISGLDSKTFYGISLSDE